jgi:hypothetical protein
MAQDPLLSGKAANASSTAAAAAAVEGGGAVIGGCGDAARIWATVFDWFVE